MRAARIDLTHGAGGRASARLIKDVFAAAFANDWLAQSDDGAVLPPLRPGERLVLSTDGHVVSPLFFPGGDIGSLSIHGTINDLAMMGARPLYLCAAFVLEEGFPLDDLRRIAASMATACAEAGVSIVAGDTKVVEAGKGDGVFITTTGAGALPEGRNPRGAGAKVGDAVIVSGCLGEHGLTILNARENLAFEADLKSDSAPLNGLVERLFEAVPADAVHCLRDPTRGGLAAALNEIADQSGVGMELDETALPIRAPVRALGELLGVDPLHLANEGKAVAVCAADHAERAVQALRSHPLGRDAAIIGRVLDDPSSFVQIRTPGGGTRLLDWMNADPLPRIC